MRALIVGTCFAALVGLGVYFLCSSGEPNPGQVVGYSPLLGLQEAVPVFDGTESEPSLRTGIGPGAMSDTFQGVVPDVPPGELTVEEIAAIWATTMSLEDTMYIAENQVFQVSENFWEHFLSKHGSLIDVSGRLGMESILGMTVNDSELEALKIQEAPFNDGLSTLASLYLSELSYAKNDIFSCGKYELVDRSPDGSFRTALPGESSSFFPGRAIFWKIESADYPQLESILEEIGTLKRQRVNALRAHLKQMK